MYAHIVWLSDLSEQAKACLEPLRCMALMGPARVTVLYARPDEKTDSEHISQHINQLVDAVESDCDLQATSLLTGGDPVSAASAHGATADLVVVGRRGSSKRDALIGSTTERVLRGTEASVLVVGGKAFNDIQQVLCPIEVGKPATVPIVHAARIARTYDATCTFLALMPFGNEQPAQDHLRELQDVVHQALEPVLRSELKARYEVGYANEPSEGICTVAEEMDLVVMGSQKKTGLARIFLGSVSEKVASRSPVPVLVARPLT